MPAIQEIDDFEVQNITPRALLATLARDKEPAPSMDADLADALLAPEAREKVRLERKPKIDHLQDGTIQDADDGSVLPLFNVGDRIVVERHVSLEGQANIWLDTEIYEVIEINDVTQVAKAQHEELRRISHIGFGPQHAKFCKIKLAPKRGNPFNAVQVAIAKKKEVAGDVGKVKKRGRKPGTKNRPKDVVKAEQEQKREAKKQKKIARKARK